MEPTLGPAGRYESGPGVRYEGHRRAVRESAPPNRGPIDRVREAEDWARSQPPDEGDRQGDRGNRFDWGMWVSAALVVMANVFAVLDHTLPFLGAALGFWFLVIHPTYLLYTNSIWKGSSSAERIGYSITGCILLLMLGGLVINTVLPFWGVTRPLSVLPVVVLGDILTISLYLFRRACPARLSWSDGFATTGPSASGRERVESRLGKSRRLARSR